ncbi:MAG: PAS domain-containing protein [Nanoarchaeota archaeon]
MTEKAEDYLVQFKNSLLSLPLGVYIWQLDNPADSKSLWLLAANAASKEMTGLDPEKIIGKHIGELFPNSITSGRAEAYARIATDGSSRIIGEVGFDVQGMTNTFRITAFGLPEQCIALVYDNITAKNKKEEDLQKTNERFEAAVKAAAIGIWDSPGKAGVSWQQALQDPNTELYFNPTFKKMAGYTDEEFLNTLGFWASLIHPDDKERVFADITAHLSAGVPYKTEHRMRLKNGVYHWFEAQGTAYFDEKGNFIRMAGYVKDINEKKQKEIELNRKNIELEHFNNLMLERELRMIELKKKIGELESKLKGKE